MTSVTDVKGVGEALGQALTANGFRTAEAIAKASPADLVKVPRIGVARAPLLIAAAKEAISTKPAVKPAATKPAARRTSTRKPAARKPVARKTVAAAEKTAEAAARKAAGGMIDRPAQRPTKKQRRQIHRFKDFSE